MLFPNTEEPIRAHDLGEFLKHFSDIYDAASVVSTRLEDEPELIILDPSKYISETIEVLSRNDEQLPPGFENSSHELICSKLSYASPLEIWFAGTVSALALAVIVAGGEIKLFGVSIKLKKSLGEALADLRKVKTQATVRKVSRTRSAKSTPEIAAPDEAAMPDSEPLPPPPASAGTSSAEDVANKPTNWGTY